MNADDASPRETTAEEECPEPSPPWNEFRVAAAKADKSAAQHDEQTTILAPLYDRIAGAAGRYDTAWVAQRKAWDDLLCRLERIGKVLVQAIGDKAKTTLDECWSTEKPKPIGTSTACSEIEDIECDESATHTDQTKLAEYRRLAALTEDCATSLKATFDELADLLDALGGKINELNGRADAIDEGMTTADHDARRSYVLYRQLDDDVKALTKLLNRTAPNPAADYACRLRKAFVELLASRRTNICIGLVIHELETRATIEQEAKDTRAGNLVDVVLECAEKKGSTTTTPSAPAATLPPS